MAEPSTVMPVRCPPLMSTGSIACRPFAPVAVDTVKDKTWLLHVSPLKAEPFRPSSQVSICSAETTGTFLATAEATTAAAAAMLPERFSSWMLAVITP